MRVAIVSDSLARGGAERQAIHAARELGRLGCDAELIYYHRVAHAYDELPDEARTTFLPKNGRSLRFLRSLRQHVRSRRFDVVHGFQGSPTLYACAAARLAGVPVVLGGVRAEYDETGLVRLGHRFVNRVADGWVVNSWATRRSMTSRIGTDPGKVFVVYNGIDPARFAARLSGPDAKRRLGIDPGVPVVSIFAVIRPQKNHRLFLEAAASVLKALPETRFLVIGGGAGQPPLEAYSRALGISDRVTFLGSRTDIPDLLAATDISVLTSHYEGLPNALMEAMAVAKPVVSTACAGIEELVSDGREGLIAPTGDREGLASRIVALLGDESLRRRLGDNGLRTVTERFSMEAMGRSLLAVYEGCLGRATVTRDVNHRPPDIATVSSPGQGGDAVP
jgi:glycosyltransferase involved in cell wall biosynthesis